MYLFFFFFFFFSSVTISEKLNQILQELKRIYNFLLTDHRKIKINVGYKIGLLFKSKNEAEVSSEFDSIGNILRDTSFLFFIETSVLHWVLCVLERGKAEGGNGIRGGEATGHRMCRWEGGWGGDGWQGNSRRAEFAGGASRTIRTCEERAMCMASFEAVGIAFRRVLPTPLTRLPPPSLTPAHSLYSSIENNNRERICRSSNKMIFRASFFSRSLFEIDSCIFLLQG